MEPEYVQAAEHSDHQPRQTYLTPSEREYALFGKGQFKIRFPELENSLITEGLKGALKFLTYKYFGSVPNLGVPSKEQQAELEANLPMQMPKFETYSDKINYTWIGHSTAVISFGKDLNILIDPVFGDRASPSSYVGPQRFRPPACTIEQLPRIDVVLVSHDHYDHLESEALTQLHKLHNPVFIAGLDSENVFPQGCQYNGLDWMDKLTLPIRERKIEVVFVPACHWSRRGMNDYNTRLWGGFVIVVGGRKVFYSGDTGYCGVFKEIGEKFGPFDLAVLPIGAYEPRELLKCQHVNPEEAVLVHKELRSRKSVGVHWGTFPLGYEHFTAARKDLEEAKIKNGLKEDEFITVCHGGNFIIDY